MNDDLTFGAHGDALMREYEAKPDGSLYTEAYMCDGGEWTVGAGNTFYMANMLISRKGEPHVTTADEPVLEGDVISPEDAEALYQWAVERRFARYVRERVKVRLNQNQFDAMVLLVWNIGAGNFTERGCRVLRYVNLREWDNAAESFALWNKGKDYSPSRDDRARPALADLISQDGRHWVRPDGTRAHHYLRGLRGLVRREHATACLSLGLDWREATRSDRISMDVKLPPRWDAAKNRWVDRLSYTPFSEVLKVAQNYPLVPDGYEEEPQPPALDDPTPETPLSTEDASFIELQRLGSDMTFEEFQGRVVRKRDVVEVPKIDPMEPPKPMEESETHRGLSKKDSGQEAVGVGATVGGIAAIMPMFSEITGFFERYSTGTMVKAAMGIGVALCAVGLWRWWRGSIIAYEGRINTTRAKV